MPSFDLQQRQTQSQVQVMSQKQIQSLELLSLGSEDLRTAVYKAAEENPALVITDDPLSQGTDVARVNKGPVDYTHVASSTTAAAREASDNFQAALESHEDMRTSLKEHLLMQYHVLHLSKAELTVGEKLIHNLNDKGFHILAPVSLLDRTDAEQTDELLEKCITIIQHLDPAGTCTSGTEESLFVQASMNPNAPLLALFILDGHFSFLNPPQPAKIVKKVTSWIQEQQSLFGQPESARQYDSLEVTEQKAAEALDFIKTLDPFPARDYGTTETQYIAPDVYVQKIPTAAEHDDFARGIVTDGESSWQLTLSHDSLPQIQVSQEFSSLATTANSKSSTITTADKKLVSDSVKKAQEFIDTVAFRESTILKACCAIVKKQHMFVAKGPGNLAPLRQQDIADELGVHETTISRMANSKFIQCEWGLFDIKYFFTNAVSVKTTTAENDMPYSASEAQPVAASKESVLIEVKKILEEHKNDAKQLSDQKVCDILAERGITIARRTVAKYRLQLNINSSYGR